MKRTLLIVSAGLLIAPLFAMPVQADEQCGGSPTVCNDGHVDIRFRGTCTVPPPPPAPVIRDCIVDVHWGYDGGGTLGTFGGTVTAKLEVFKPGNQLVGTKVASCVWTILNTHCNPPDNDDTFAFSVSTCLAFSVTGKLTITSQDTRIFSTAFSHNHPDSASHAAC